MKTALIVKKGSDAAQQAAAKMKAQLDAHAIAVVPADTLQQVDFVTAVGGDGTIMHAAKQAALFNKPVLGVNAGHVGFLAGMEPDEAGLLTALADGNYRVEERMLLEVMFTQNGQPVTALALNEVAVTRGGPARMLDIQVRVGDHRQILSYRADGLLVATPTGSTAYSLSAGGPVLDPSIEGMVLTPLCPYSLQARSLVFAADHVLHISARCQAKVGVYVCVDGEDPLDVSGQEITVRRAVDRRVRLIRLKDDPFFIAYKNKIIDRSN